MSIPESLETQDWVIYIEKSDLNITERVIQLYDDTLCIGYMT